MPYYFATVEQWVAHWNTFHVAVAPVITCVVTGCPAKLHTGPETVDAFFRHLQNRHPGLSESSKWPRLNQLVRAGMSIGPNTSYRPPSLGNGPHLGPDQVNHLTAEEMEDPFLAAMWISRTEFHNLVRKRRPKPKKDGKARKGGHTSSREAPGAKHRRGRDDGHSATDESDSGAASSLTSLTGIAPSTSGTQRGRPRGDRHPNTYTWQAAWQQQEVAGKTSQPGRKSQGTPFTIAIKERKRKEKERA